MSENKGGCCLVLIELFDLFSWLISEGFILLISVEFVHCYFVGVIKGGFC